MSVFLADCEAFGLCFLRRNFDIYSQAKFVGGPSEIFFFGIVPQSFEISQIFPRLSWRSLSCGVWNFKERSGPVRVFSNRLFFLFFLLFLLLLLFLHLYSRRNKTSTWLCWFSRRSEHRRPRDMPFKLLHSYARSSFHQSFTYRLAFCCITLKLPHSKYNSSSAESASDTPHIRIVILPYVWIRFVRTLRALIAIVYHAIFKCVWRPLDWDFVSPVIGASFPPRLLIPTIHHN